MKLVPDWKAALKWHSTQVLIVLSVLPLVWAELPPDLKKMVPAEWEPYLFSLIAIAGIIGRVRSQD